MNRVVVNVATGRYLAGQARLSRALAAAGEETCFFNAIPESWSSQTARPYAFKAHALHCADVLGAETLLWADACVLPLRSLEPLWERIERDGYWISRNGWSNYEWTADSAYPELFPKETVKGSHLAPDLAMFLYGWGSSAERTLLEKCRAINRKIEHVVATCFGISLRHQTGQAILKEYYRLASETNAFCGPWINSNSQSANEVQQHSNDTYCGPCGPTDVRGHRHDQTALSVIAWRLGCQLTSPPDICAYRGGETESTIVCFDGAY